MATHQHGSTTTAEHPTAGHTHGPAHSHGAPAHGRPVHRPGPLGFLGRLVGGVARTALWLILAVVVVAVVLLALVF